MTQARHAAIILAAGASSRLGQPKQLLEVGGETLLERAARLAHQAGFSPVVVVLGANAQQIRRKCELKAEVVVRNENWREGMASSIRAGLGALASAHRLSGILLMTCDQPAVTADHLRMLASTGTVTASLYASRRGVPAYFPVSTLPDLAKLTGDSGARTLLASAQAIPLRGGELDIDTPADLALLQSL